MSDRIAGIVLILLAIAFWVLAGNYEAGFGDPIGPVVFPRIVAVPLGLFALYMVVRPDPAPAWPTGDRAVRQVALVAVLFAFPYLIEPLGFPLAAMVASFCFCLLLGARTVAAGASAAGIGAGLFVVFDTLLGLPLPAMPTLFSP